MPTSLTVYQVAVQLSAPPKGTASKLIVGTYPTEEAATAALPAAEARWAGPRFVSAEVITHEVS